MRKNLTKTYLFFDNVRIVKNISNNLLNAKKLAFPLVLITIQGDEIKCSSGYITWADLHFLYDQDLKLQGNLKKAPKLTYKALHLGNNKQDVNLPLAIFHDTTIAPCKSYLPERQDTSSFSHSCKQLVDNCKCQEALCTKCHYGWR